MPWYCSICTDIFNDFKTISTTPCGHMFHLDCVKKWIVESGTCPECRQLVSLHRLVKLHPHEITCDGTQSNENYFTCKAELNEKEEELRKLKNQNEELTIYVAKAESEASLYFQEKCKLEFQLKSANLQKNFIKSLESKIAKLEKINKQLNLENEYLNGVKAIVNGTQSDAEEVLTSYSSNASEENAAKKLATYCSILKRELDRVIQEKKKLKSESLQMKNKCSNYNSNIAQLQNLVKKLKNDISMLEKGKRESSFQISSDCNTSFDSKQTISAKDITAENDLDYSPITVKFTEHPKKIGVKIVEDELPTSSKLSVFKDKKVDLSKTSTLPFQEDSIIRIGYNGFGGHGSVINKTCKNHLPKRITSKRTKSSHYKLLSPMLKKQKST